MAGERDARRILWELGASFEERELAARLVQFHQWPFFIFNKPHPERTAIHISQVARCDLLAVVAEADLRGRVCEDLPQLLENVELFRELCGEMNCLHQPFAFASDHARFEYFRHNNRDPNYAAYDESEFTCTLMSGLPASGKDTWLKQHFAEPIISLDALRTQLGIRPGGDQRSVVVTAREHAKEFLRKKQPFAWNATNLTRKRRRQLVDLLTDYGARVRIVHCESDLCTLLKRNRSRENAVPDDALQKMLRSWEAPDRTEAHVLEISVTP